MDEALNPQTRPARGSCTPKNAFHAALNHQFPPANAPAPPKPPWQVFCTFRSPKTKQFYPQTARPPFPEPPEPFHPPFPDSPDPSAPPVPTPRPVPGVPTRQLLPVASGDAMAEDSDPGTSFASLRRDGPVLAGDRKRPHKGDGFRVSATSGVVLSWQRFGVWNGPHGGVLRGDF